MIRKNRRRIIVAIVLALAFAVVLVPGLFGRGEPQADPMVVDAHLQQLKAEKAAEERQSVAAARAREDVREREMAEKAARRGG